MMADPTDEPRPAPGTRQRVVDVDRELLAIADRYAQNVQIYRNVLMIRHARNDHYVNGNQFIDYDPVSNQFFELEAGSEFAHTNNQLVTFVRSRAAMLAKSRGKYQADPLGTDRRLRHAARFAQAFCDHELAEQPEDERYMEGLRMTVHGRSYRREVATLTGPPVRMPQLGAQPFQAGEDAYFCTDCGQGGRYAQPQPQQPQPGGAAPAELQQPPQGAAPGEPDAAAAPADACPSCGSANVTVTRAERAEAVTVTGYAEQPSVKLETHWISDYHHWWDPGAGTPSLSPWREIRTLAVKEVVEDRYPDADVRVGFNQTGEDLGLEYQRMLERSAGAYDTNPFAVANGAAGGYGPTDELRCEVREVWLSRDLIKNLIPRADTKIGKRTLRKGVPLGVQLPDGARFVVIGHKLVDIESQDANDVLTDFADGLRPNSGYARGIEDWIPLQDRLNTYGTWTMTWLAMCAVGNLVANPDLITQPEMRNALGVPGKVIEADGCLTGEDLSHAVTRVSGEPFQPAVVGLEERAKGDLQTMSATYATASGVPNAPIDTATGVNAMLDQVQQLQAPVLRLRAWSEAQWLKRRLKLARKYYWDPVFIRGGAKAGALAGQMITRVDIDGEFSITPVEDSYLTRTAGQVRSDVVAALKLGYGQPNLPDEVQDLIAKTFAVDDVDAKGARWRMVAEMRIARVLDAAEQIAPELDQALAAVPEGQMVAGPDGQPLDARAMVLQTARQNLISAAMPEEDDADPVFVNTYTDWRISDEGLAAPKWIRQAFLDLVHLHKQQAVAKAQEQQAMELAATAPARQAAAAEAGAQSERDEAAKDREAGRRQSEADRAAEREDALRSRDADRRRAAEAEL